MGTENQSPAAEVEPLLELAKNEDPTAQRRAIDALAPLQDPRIEPLLRTFQTSPHLPVRMAALYALAQRGDPFAVTKLQMDSRDQDPQVSLAANVCLAYLGRASGITSLLRQYFDADLQSFVRPVLFALPPAAAQELVPVLRQAPPGAVLTAACDVCGVIGLAAALPELERIGAGEYGNATITAIVAAVRMSGDAAALKEKLAGIADPLSRLVVASFLRELARPMPVAVGAALLDDPCVAIAMLGLELLALERDPSARAPIQRLLERERRRKNGELPPLDPAQNQPLLGEPELAESIEAIGTRLVASLPAPLRERLASTYPQPWTDAAAALARIAVAAAFIVGANDAVEAFLAA